MFKDKNLRRCNPDQKNSISNFGMKVNMMYKCKTSVNNNTREVERGNCNTLHIKIFHLENEKCFRRESRADFYKLPWLIHMSIGFFYFAIQIIDLYVFT